MANPASGEVKRVKSTGAEGVLPPVCGRLEAAASVLLPVCGMRASLTAEVGKGL